MGFFFFFYLILCSLEETWNLMCSTGLLFLKEGYRQTGTHAEREERAIKETEAMLCEK